MSSQTPIPILKLMSPKKTISLIIFFVMVLFGMNAFETVEKGTYQIRQFPITGTLSVKLDPGMWCQCFGDVQTWPVSTTFDFSKSRQIPTRFNDGSQSAVLGSVRVYMPKSSEMALEIITKHGFRSINSVMEQLIYPHLGRVLRLTGNLMSAKESFDEKRADFDSMAFDQLLNGVYKTATNAREVTDPLTGKKTIKHFKVVLRDEQGNIQREGNPMEGTGITFDAFRITSIHYPKVVENQIEAQRKAIMEVETARANAKKAEQDAKTIEMKGKADVMQSKYEKEQEKVKAVVEAQQQKEVAELHAAKELEVAKLMKLAAKEEKERQILLGQGESERKKLVMNADGALAQKLQAWKEVNNYYAEAMKNYKGQWVPNVVMSGGQNGQNTNAAQSLLDLFMVKTAKDLSLDMTVPSGKTTKRGNNR